MAHLIFLSRYIFAIIIVFFLLENFCLLNGSGSKVFDVTISTILVFHFLAFAILTREIGVIKSFSLGIISLFVSIMICRRAKNFIPNSGLVLLSCALFLFDIGLVMLCRIDFSLAIKQFTWFIIGTAVLFAVPHLFNFISRYKWLNIIFMLGSIILLGMNFFYAKRVNGALNWISLYDKFSFQPSEIVKLFYIPYLATAFQKDKRFYFLPTLFTLAIILFLAMQRDFGSALIFFVIYVCCFYVATSDKKIFLFAVILILLAFTVGYFVFPHIKSRIISWLNPWQKINDCGYQITQSLFAIYDGNLFGNGLTCGFVKYIPVATSDFIFSAICEEFGCIFASGIILIFMLMALAISKIINLCTGNFSVMFLVNTMVLFSFQAFLIIGGCIKLIPVTGVTLPFISYGGTSLVINIVLLSMVIYTPVKLYEQIIDESEDE